MASHEDRLERLDQPKGLKRPIVRRPDYDPETFGRFAEGFARFMGTARFLVFMTVVIIVWLLWNTLCPPSLRFDGFPFIFLTLILSLQASYAAPLILLAQNRQESRDRVTQAQDREAATRSHADMEYLAREVASLRLRLGEIATRDFLRSELRGLFADLDGSRGERRPPDDAAGAADPATG
ncbi:MAG: DUF1003 domain-containing protein [Nocardioidaceae bacterium]|jgi:uncharacterized membrane protein|nr:DUF1003 domain-containing protein [Nocardioidaceae bacterium]